MEKLGNKGNGHYAYVDNLSEARRIFVENLTGMLQVIARDVKIQVDFDPEVVRSYRLLGYENRDVEDSKFRDNKEDGGEIGSGHSVTALYEIKLQKESNPTDLGTVFVRYKNPDGETVAEIDRVISMGQCRALFTTATTELKTAAIAAEFAEILRNSYWARGSKLDDLLAIASTLYVETNSTDLLELMHLISRADGLKQIAEK
jgi:Ca-activated chloride channel family protein